ncbi:unknown [Cercopithecine alphaherpesvirus 9]|uniref:Uncharacterized protein n=2 Tax=Cercopithecine alphaherpesvirus 9 TaxID=35246 RepID=A0A2D0TCK6_CHV9D|nr:membrane protein UL56 [Cercopithecine alphaherpesvirus 9]AAF36993.1 unknown [Cercopithecine alphaherpesvirus 9]AAG27181.1 unknown [Cercopithecine alphaherpesvirus 9]
MSRSPTVERFILSSTELTLSSFSPITYNAEYMNVYLPTYEEAIQDLPPAYRSRETLSTLTTDTGCMDCICTGLYKIHERLTSCVRYCVPAMFVLFAVLTLTAVILVILAAIPDV